VSGQRLRLTTSRPAGYRRGGQVIGNAGSPTFLGRDDMSLEQVLAVLRDPNIAVAVETEEDVFTPLSSDERAAIVDGIEHDLAQIQPNTAEPQGEGLTPGAEASQAGGPDATADGSAASAGDAATTEPTAPELAPAPEPAATPKPSSKGRGKAKGSPA
jgi:hypothetical protein